MLIEKLKSPQDYLARSQMHASSVKFVDIGMGQGQSCGSPPTQVFSTTQSQGQAVQNLDHKEGQ